MAVGRVPAGCADPRAHVPQLEDRPHAVSPARRGDGIPPSPPQGTADWHIFRTRPPHQEAAYNRAPSASCGRYSQPVPDRVQHAQQGVGVGPGQVGMPQLAERF